MNVILSNKYTAMLKSLDIEIIKKLEGEYDVNYIIDNFSNFYFQRMILDITSLKNYKDISNLQRLSISMDMDKIILLLDEETTGDNNFLSTLVSMGIYNFATNKESILYLYNNPNSYRDVAHIHQLSSNLASGNNETNISVVNPTDTSSIDGENGKDGKNTGKVEYVDRVVTKIEEKIVMKETVVIGIKNITKNAGATTLIHMMKQQLEENYNVAVIEIVKSDFKYFKETNYSSVTIDKLPYELMKYNDKDIIFVDMNDCDDDNLMMEVIYLVEPSTLKLNHMIATKYNILSKLKDKKVLLNKSLLSNKDILDFEYESKMKVFFNMPPLDDRRENIVINMFLNKVGFEKQEVSNKGFFGIFKL